MSSAKFNFLMIKIGWKINKLVRMIFPAFFYHRWLLPARDILMMLPNKLRYLFGSGKMKKGKNIIFISGESNTPGHIYRVERYLITYQAIGFNAFWFKPDHVFVNPGILDHCILLILWRARMNKALASTIKRARKKNIKIIFDLDDYMFDPGIVKVGIIDGIRSMDLNVDEVSEHYNNVGLAVKASDVFTSPTGFLSQAVNKTGKPAYVMPNGYDEEIFFQSTLLRIGKKSNGPFVKIGYAGGTRTHQKDFKLVLPALIKILEEFPQVRLTIFTEALLLKEFKELQQFSDRIEARKMVALSELQNEIARYDINIAPLEFNDFCQAKSELKYFEAALLQIPTIASPTKPYRNIIEHGVNGLLAENENEWYDCLKLLIEKPEVRNNLGKKAFTHVLWNFGPEQRLHLTCNLLKNVDKGLYRNIRQFSLFNQAQKFRKENVSLYPSLHFDYPVFPDYQVTVAYNSVNFSKVGVIIPMFNYESYVLDALESVKNQTLKNIDLVVIDDCSTDRSLNNAVDWIDANHERFNRCAVIRNPENCGLALTRNAGFDYLQTPWIMQLDADNELLPECLEISLERIENSGAAMAFGQLELFGENQELINHYYTHPTIGNKPWNPADFVPGNYIDAMALLSKAHWAKAGGYFTNFRVHGWEDYDLWLRFIEHGFYGIYIPKIIARYRIHDNSMLRKTSEINQNERHKEIKLRHPWVD